MLDVTALFVLLVVMALRPLVGETYDIGGEAMSAAVGQLVGVTPVRTIAFDLAILMAVGLWGVGQAIGPRTLRRRTGLEWGFLLVAVACVISCMFASNKRIALNASLDFLCIPMLIVILTQLLQTDWHRKLVLAVVMASATVQAFQCLSYVYVEQGETRAQYYANKETFWAAQGIELDAAKVKLFEARLDAREASGFLSHPNVVGSLLAMCGFCGGGLALSQLRRSTSGGALLTMAVCLIAWGVIVWALWLTGSGGALWAGGGGLVLWLLVWRCGSWIDRHRTRVLLGTWLLFLVGAVGVVTTGMTRGSLPGSSLGFRWQYWTASSQLVADHAFAGVGRENFGRHYVAYKDIASPEEVSNPHNLFMQTAVDWGALGLAGLVLMLVGASREMMRRPCTDPEPPEERKNTSNGATNMGTVVTWMACLAGTLTLLRIPLLSSHDPDYVYYMSVACLIPWLAGFASFAWDHDRGPSALPGVVHTGLAIGLLTFLVHELINFALFVPGSATTFAALLGCGLSARGLPIKRHPSARWRWAWPMSVLVLIVLIGVFMLSPAYRVGQAMLAAQQAKLVRGSLTDQSGWRLLSQALVDDPLDPMPAVGLAEYGLALAKLPEFSAEALPAAAEAAKIAVARDPANVSRYRLLRRACEAQARASGAPADWAQAIAAARSALARYPQDPSGLVRLGKTLAHAGEATNNHNWLAEAVESYRAALVLDDKRLWWEEFRRFDENQISEINTDIQRLTRMIHQTSASTP